jgi:Skp family chaperone for outer membrane proteins
MIRLPLLALLLLTLSGCVVATVAGVAVGAVKTAASAAGTVVETAVDAATTTQQEADEDRGRAIRLEEERQRREAERQNKAAEKAAREAGLENGAPR